MSQVININAEMNYLHLTLSGSEMRHQHDSMTPEYHVQHTHLLKVKTHVKQ